MSIPLVPLHISYKYPYVRGVHSVWQGDMGICEIHQKFPKTLKHNRREHTSVPTKNQHLWEDSDGKSPFFFLEHLSQVCQVGHTIDRCITLMGLPRYQLPRGQLPPGQLNKFFNNSYWELTSWEVDLMGVDFVGFDLVHMNHVIHVSIN